MKLGVIGATLGHTASPAIHEKLFRLLGVEGEHEYGVLEMDRDRIPSELERLQQEGYTGANVTIPYKLEVMPYLTEISREALTIGAVNTLHFTQDGIFGYNTDYGGFGRSLQHASIDIAKKDCYVLGTGGGARAIIQYLRDGGASTITVVSRKPHQKRDLKTLPKNSMSLSSTMKPLKRLLLVTFSSIVHLLACSLITMAVPYRKEH